MKSDVFLSLNSSQLSAVESTLPVTIINAGPGTGKTKTLIARIAYLILEQNASPSSILAITFTKKAAAEMRERLQQILPEETIPYVGTFHSFAYDVVSREKEIHLIDDIKRKQIIESLLKKEAFAGIGKKDADRTISLYKSRINERSDSQNQSDAERDQFVLDYNDSLKKQQLMDFDDILLALYELLQSIDKHRELQSRFRHLLVDEFQDTNEVQYEIIKKLFIQKQNDRSLFIIGDPQQAIYSFRGALDNMFVRVKTDFPEAYDTILATNYRSAENIIHVSSLLFPESEKLIPNRKMAGSVNLIYTINEYTEADAIVRLISTMVGGTDLLGAAKIADHVQTIGFSDVAVVYRNHRVCSIIQEKLFHSGIPTQVIGEGSPYEQIEIRFLIDCLRFIYDKRDQTMLKLKEYPFTRSQSEIKSVLEQYEIDAKPGILIHKIVQHFRLLERFKEKDERCRNLVQFQNSMSRFDNKENGLQKSIEYLDFIQEHEFYDIAADKVTLLTMHASKGLEFKVVVVCAFEDGTIPSIKKDTDVEEEKRLLYVAMTRAKDNLYFFSARSRNKKQAVISRFKQYIECKELLVAEDEASEGILKRSQKSAIKKSQMKMF